MIDDLHEAFDGWASRVGHLRQYRDYYDGRHLAPYASPAFKARYLWLIAQSRENLMPAAVSAFTDLIEITGWDTAATVDKDLTAGLGRLAAFVHREAFTTGNAFTLTWQNRAGEVRPIFYRGDQLIPHVSDDDPEVLAWAVLPSIDKAGYGRATIYYQDVAERWITRDQLRDASGNVREWPDSSAAWKPYVDPIDGTGNLPHGFGAVPVCWWKRDPEDQWSYGRSVLKDAIPSQDELNFNKAVTNAAVERIGRPIRWALADDVPEGSVEFDPTTEDILTLTAKSAGEFGGPDAAALVALQANAEHSLANVIGVPPYVFTQSVGDVPSGVALRILNSRRTSSVAAFCRDASAVWRGQMQLLGVDAEPVWADPMPMAEQEAVDIAVAKRRDLGYALQDAIEDLGEADAEGIVQRAQAAAESDRAATARQWAQGNLLNGA